MSNNSNSAHLRREIKFESNDGSKMCYGTMNRNAAKSVYLIYNPAFMVRTAFDSTQYENALRKETRHIINEAIRGSKKTITGTIVDMRFSKQLMEPNVKSKVLFELFIGTGEKFQNVEEYDAVMKEIGNKVSGIVKKHIGELVDFI